jgi:hypothetical protein
MAFGQAARKRPAAVADREQWATALSVVAAILAAPTIASPPQNLAEFVR